MPKLSSLLNLVLVTGPSAYALRLPSQTNLKEKVRGSCYNVDPTINDPKWCDDSCNNNPPVCPCQKCNCDTANEAINRGVVNSCRLTCTGTPSSLSSWCDANCNHVPKNCPPSLCQCTAVTTTSTVTTTTTTDASLRTSTTSTTSTSTCTDDPENAQWCHPDYCETNMFNVHKFCQHTCGAFLSGECCADDPRGIDHSVSLTALGVSIIPCDASLCSFLGANETCPHSCGICATRVTTTTTTTTTPPGILPETSEVPFPGSAVGDPHVMDIKGNRFDIIREGRADLLVIKDGKNVLLEVQGLIRRVLRCRGAPLCKLGLFITEVTLAGSWAKKKFHFGVEKAQAKEEPSVLIDGTEAWPLSAEDPIFSELSMKVQNFSTSNQGLHFDFMGTTLDVRRVVQNFTICKEDNKVKFFNINIREVQKLLSRGMTVGGILGNDPHDDWEKCDISSDGSNLFQTPETERNFVYAKVQ